jgi:hypothetical protein
LLTLGGDNNGALHNFELMNDVKLYMAIVGCRPKGRHTEQHDVFFGIATSIKNLVPVMLQFWPEAKGNMHIDAWREITVVEGFKIEVTPKEDFSQQENRNRLFFLNLGGYKKDEFDEFHYKLVVIASSKTAAIKKAKETAFYKHTGFTGAPSHIDDKFGIDVDEVFEINEILPANMKENYSINITSAVTSQKDELHLGYFRLDKL